MAANYRDEEVLTQKSSNFRPNSKDQKRKCSNFPKMSPEASRAMGMVRDEAKENINSPAFNSESYGAAFESGQNIHRGATFDSNNNENKSQTRNIAHDGAGRQRHESSGRRVQRLPPRYMKPPVSRSSISNNPARSRSTLSHSDNTESCNQTSSASVYTNNNSTSHTGNINNDGYHANKAVFNPVDDDDSDNADEDNDELGALSMEQDFINGNAMPVKEKSFVHALDKALERNSISRLKGDITDTTRITQPGTVRALDGGRLANAQEVVVNVCHNDVRQLVFHDDDEETLDTAKEISQIRVSIWMEYNSSFPPDNDVHELQIPGVPEQSSSHKTLSSGARAGTPVDKKSAGSQKSRSSDGKTTGPTSRNINNRNSVPTRASPPKFSPPSTARPKTTVPHPKSAKSESSGSSRGPSQNGVPVVKRGPGNARTKRQANVK